MELSEIEVKPGAGDSVLAELRADAPWGDRGYWILIGGWGGSESEARDQIDAAMCALGLDTDKLRKAL